MHVCVNVTYIQHKYMQSNMNSNFQNNTQDILCDTLCTSGKYN